MNRASIQEDCRQALHGRDNLLQALRGDTILIAGGTGFLGTWLAEMLACLNDDFKFGCKIILLARGIELFAATRPHLASRADTRLIRADVKYLSEVPREINWLLHAAATPDNRFHASTPVETISTIVEGTANLIRALDTVSNFKRLLFLSSGYVYGKQPWDLPAVPETYEGSLVSLNSSASAYGEAKRCAEILCASARSEKRLPVAIARPFAFLGPYQALNTPWAANNFLLDALSNRPIRIQGDGETVRSYMYGSDAAYWLLRILTADETMHAWNVGSPHEVTLKSLAATIAEFENPPLEVRLHAATHGNPPRSRFVPDVSAAAKKLGLDVRVSLRDAIAKTLQWNRAQARPIATTR